MNYEEASEEVKAAFREGMRQGSRDGYDSGFTDGENAAIDWSFDSGYQEGFSQSTDLIIDSLFSIIGDMVENDTAYTLSNQEFVRAMKYIEGPPVKNVSDMFRNLKRSIALRNAA